MCICLIRIQGTIYKCNNYASIDNTTIMRKEHNIDSWCQKHWIARTIDSRISLCQTIWISRTLCLLSCFQGLTIFTRTIVWIPHEHSETWTFINSFYIFQCSLNFSPLFPQQGGEIYEQEVNLDNLLSFHGNTCSRYPSQGTQATLTQDKETKKV